MRLITMLSKTVNFRKQGRQVKKVTSSKKKAIESCLSGPM